MANLKPANENPWYVLMTLYGEQTGEEIDWDLHAKNRAVWNAWSCQNLSEPETAELAQQMGLDPEELRGWPERKAEIEMQHEKTWKARNRRGKYPSMPDVGNKVDLANTTLANRIDLEKFVFSADTHFASATFSATAHFISATFRDVTVFSETIFSGVAAFESTTFNFTAFGTTTFKAEAHFRSATFNAAAEFSSATFHANAYFISATFNANADFSSVTFIAKVKFRSATFGGAAEFRSANFCATADFLSAHFLGFSSFAQATFDNKNAVENYEVSFRDCQFEKPLNFRSANFTHGYPEFSSAVLHSTAIFTAKAENWPAQIEDSNLNQARASCAVIRDSLAKQGLPEDEHFFFRREMQFAGQINGKLNGLPYRFFGWVSDYGYSIARPVWGLFYLLLACGLIYFVYFTWQEVYNGEPHGTFEGAALSFASTFKIFGFQRLHFGSDYIQKLPAFLEFLTAFQTIGGFVLLFFLGLGLRTRFRLR